MVKIPVEDEEKIIGLLLRGKTTRETGELVGRSPSTVSNIAKRHGLDLVALAHDRLKRAQLVGAYASAEARAAVAVKGLKKGEEILDTTTGARDYRDAMVGLGIGLDKLRLELPHDENKGGEILQLVAMLRGEEAEDDAN